MKKKPKILVVGSFVMDLIVSTEKFPGSGETVLGKGFRTAPGGKGANQAIQAARLGADVTMLGQVGDDEFGQKLIRSCLGSGIHTEFIRTDTGTSSGIGNVILETDGTGRTRNRIIVVPGANMTIKAENIAFLKDTIGQYDFVMLQLEIPMAINERVAQYAFEKGVPVMLNSAPSASLSPELLSRLTYISPNEHEAADLTGIEIRRDGGPVDRDNVQKTVDTLLSRGVKNVVITLGNAGAVAATRNELIYQPCADVVDVLDPTAAGDSFVGAFTVGICSGLSHGQALCFANYAAALTVSGMGAQPSLPNLSAVIRLMKENGQREFDFSMLDVLR